MVDVLATAPALDRPVQPDEVPLLEAVGITKLYGDFVANDGINLEIWPAEVHALLGENGAGKSTLVKMIYGLLQPSAGEFRWRGQPVVLAGPAAARAHGIGMVFQHFSLFEQLTVGENVALGLDNAPLAGIDERVAEVSRAYGLPLDPRREVWRLSVGERQRIEIVRCLLQDPRLLILDEPTSVLTPQEAEQLFRTLRVLRKEGRAILYISHKLEEVRALCDTATILRGGKVIATCDPRAETAQSLAGMMVGGEVGVVRSDGAKKVGQPRLVVRNLNFTPDDPHGVKLDNVTFELAAGEILGLAGVAGNGQDELFAVLSGEQLVADPDAIKIDGRDAGRLSISDRRRLGAAFVPEERLGHATAPRFKLSDNALISGHAASPMVRRGFIDRSQMLAFVERITKAYDVRKAKPDPEAMSLSGGNLQKYCVGREILREPRLLIVSQPTWGVDAGAAAAIRQAIIDLAARGAAVLVMSQDLDELYEISDRLVVISAGRLSASRAARRFDRGEIGMLMAGVGMKGKGRGMRLALERRSERSILIALASPLLAVALTLVTGAIAFALLGKPPIEGLRIYFFDPLTDPWALQEIAVKATPLVLIAVGLSLCYLANGWNIGAEGQFLVGAITGGWLAVVTHGTGAGYWVLPAMLLLGAAGGALYALIPALFKVRFGASEILTSLMLVYVAELLLDYLVRGPWRDPKGFNFPTTAEFDFVAAMPTLIEGSRLHLGAIIALLVVIGATIMLGRTLRGFEIKLVGAAPRAARFAGFNDRTLIVVTFLISGALAGLAGVIEISATVNHLQPNISPGYGFTAIIVAFLGRLHPVGILIASLFLALTFIGGESAQISLKVPLDLTKVFQGILLFYVLACDTLILYRFRLVFPKAAHGIR